MKDKPLTQKESLFCTYYSIKQNGVEAAVKAGYSVMPEKAALKLLKRENIRMFIIDSIVDSVKTTLISGFSELDSLVKVKLAYEKNAIPNPLKKAYVVLSPEKITVVPYRTDDPLVTKQVTYKISINIHCPESANPQRLLEIFNYTVIILDDSNLYDIEEAECGEIKTDANTNSIFLPCTVLFTQYC